jgi:hypothetical protein
VKIFSSEINDYARKHRVSYQEAWRTLVNEASESYTEKQPSATKFAMKEPVKILNMSEEGTVADIAMSRVWTCPKYTVVLNGSGRVLTLNETELIKKG